MRFQLKGFTSLLLALFFLALGFSGVILYLTPRGRVANWTGWTILGLEKQDWQAIHINIALLFLIAAGLHLFFNWTMFWGYIKKKASLGPNLKMEMLAALLIAGGVILGTIQGVPPFGTLMTLNNRVKDHWERTPVTAPLPHAEELTLEQLAGTLGLPVQQVMDALRQDRIAAENTTVTVAQVAEANGLTPSDVYASLQKHFPETQQAGQGQAMGLGQGDGAHQPGDGRGRGRGMGRGRGW